MSEPKNIFEQAADVVKDYLKTNIVEPIRKSQEETIRDAEYYMKKVEEIEKEEARQNLPNNKKPESKQR